MCGTDIDILAATDLFSLYVDVFAIVFQSFKRCMVVTLMFASRQRIPKTDRQDCGLLRLVITIVIVFVISTLHSPHPLDENRK